MSQNQQPDKRDAFALFPDLMQRFQGSTQVKKRKHVPERPAKKSKEGGAAIPRENVVLPPAPPDLSWLGEETFAGQEKVEDIPMALVLMEKGQGKDLLSADLQELGYLVERADSPAEALEKLKFTSFAAIVMHVGFGQETLAESRVYRYITWLPPSKRRTLFYILVGPGLRTLYDLEAISLSVNLVINESDVEYLKPIVRKSFRDHEELFGPLVEALDAFGRRS